MRNYILQRLLATVVTLFIILSIGFVVLRLMPGNIFEGYDELTPEMLAALESKYNFDKPIIVQYFLYLKNIILNWDWGLSIKLYPNMPVWDIVAQKIPVTLYVNVYSLCISLPLGMLAGIVMALKKNSGVDYLVSFLVVIFISCRPSSSRRACSTSALISGDGSRLFMTRAPQAWQSLFRWYCPFWRWPSARSRVSPVTCAASWPKPLVRTSCCWPVPRA